MDIATYPNLPASAEKCPLSNSPGMSVTVDSPVFAASVPLQIMRRSWSTLMSCDWRPPLGTDTLVSLTGTPITVLRVAMVLRNIPLWCEKEKTKTTRWILLLKRFSFTYYHICVTLGQFKGWTFHVLNLIPSIKYMRRSMFESIKSNLYNSTHKEWYTWEFWLWSDLVSNVKLVMCQIWCIITTI